MNSVDAIESEIHEKATSEITRRTAIEQRNKMEYKRMGE